MKWRCPQPDKARKRGCPDIKEDGRCIRKEWSGGITYFKEKKLHALLKRKFIVSGLNTYCEKSELAVHRIVTLYPWAYQCESFQ